MNKPRQSFNGKQKWISLKKKKKNAFENAVYNMFVPASMG